MNWNVENNTINERKSGSGRPPNSFYEITSKSEKKKTTKRENYRPASLMVGDTFFSKYLKTKFKNTSK